MTHQRPLIGVTTSEVRTAEHTYPSREGDPPRVEMALGMRYTRAIEAAGGVPVVVPPLGAAAIDGLLAGLAGLCVSGGPDLDPSGYGHDRHPELGPTEVDLDRFELTVARAADGHGMPILGICRGMQALNVARGGTLYQHLPDLPSTRLQHRQTEDGERPTHAVDVSRESRLGGLLGADSALVNSFHHQAVDQLGDSMQVVARAPDGVVEAVEDPDRDFLIGVQWHAECLAEKPEHLALFEGLVEAAARFTPKGSE